MKRILSYILVAVMLLAVLAGCNSASKHQLKGTWTGKADLATAYETMLAAADPGMTGHIDIQNFTVDLTLTFEDNGTYKWEADEAQLKTGSKNMMKAISDGLATYLQIEAGMPINQLLQASGKTMDEIMEEYFDPNMDQVIRGQLCSKGTYDVKDGKLILTNDKGIVIFEGDIAISKGVLEIKNGTTNSLITQLIPLSFQKN